MRANCISKPWQIWAGIIMLLAAATPSLAGSFRPLTLQAEEPGSSSEPRRFAVEAGKRSASSGEGNFANCDEFGRYMVHLGQIDPEEYESFGAGGGDSPPSSAPLFSTTNLQEIAVDEPDLVKTDGQYIYVAHNGWFSIFSAYPPERMTLVYTEELPASYQQELFLYHDQAILLLSDYSTTRIRWYDLDDKARPALLREYRMDGSLEGARRSADRLVLLLRNSNDAYWLNELLWLEYPELLESPDAYFGSGPMGAPVPAGSTQTLPEELLSLFSQMPRIQRADYRGEEITRQSADLVPCDSVTLPSFDDGADLLTVLQFDLAEPDANPQSSSFIGIGSEIYASAEHLYVIGYRSSNWWFVATPVRENGTRLSRFTISGDLELDASGLVPGEVLNRFALSEWNGYLRVATTEGSGGWNADTNNMLLVLQAREGGFDEIGRLEGLGLQGESIYAVRFHGDRGYVVTYRNTDPLYTLDLSDPLNPRAVGELKVPGYSTYLHPVGEDRLLGIGVDPETWRTELSLYDIADFADPRLLDRHSLGEGSWSEALYEPHAFNWFAPASLLSIPAGVWQYGYEEETGELFRVDLDQGFIPLGSREGAVRRTLFLGDGEKFYWYTLTDRTLATSDVESPELIISQGDVSGWSDEEIGIWNNYWGWF